jgi:hypothetical protein
MYFKIYITVLNIKWGREIKASTTDTDVIGSLVLKSNQVEWCLYDQDALRQCATDIRD